MASFLKDQRHKQRACDCGRSTIYTSADMRKYNKTLDGVEVCEVCYVDHVVNGLLDKFNKEG